jgi:fatty acid omega-hydroxylase
MSDVFGQGIFVTDGAAWKTTRQTTARIFNANNFNVCVPDNTKNAEAIFFLA